MTLEDEILNMYNEIANASGNPGDPVEGIAAPFERLQGQSLSQFERAGLCVAALCLLEGAIDNSTHAQAVERHLAQAAAHVQEGPPGIPSVILDAFSSFERSEEAFARALQRVYHDFVVGQLASRAVAHQIDAG